MTGRPSSFTQDDEVPIYLTPTRRTEAQVAYNRSMSALCAAIVGTGYDKPDDGPDGEESE